MSSSTDERSRQALALLRSWERSSIRFSETATSRADEDQNKLVKFCAPEIASALRESGTFLISSGYTLAEIIREVAHAGVLRASETLRERPGRIFLEYVRLCVVVVMEEPKADQEKQLRSFTSEQVLDVIQTMSRHDAALVLDRLSFGQRNELMEFAPRQLSGKCLKLSLCSESKPESVWLWLICYLGRLHSLEPAAEQAFTKENKAPQTHLLIDPTGELNPQPKNNQGNPIDLAGPMHARAWEELSRMSHCDQILLYGLTTDDLQQ